MNERELRLLASQGAVRDVAVSVLEGGGYTVTVNGLPLESHRRNTRRFAKLDTVQSFLAGVGVREYRVTAKRKVA